MKRKHLIKGVLLRSVFLWLVIQASCGSAPVHLTVDAQSWPSLSSPIDGRLTLEARVRYQRAIDNVYWRHRIWPEQNGKRKPDLEEVVPGWVIRAKVEDYLRKSQALALYWQRPIRGEQLQAEMDRMARQTQNQAVLSELWVALENDPSLIAECLARPLLVNRLIRNWYGEEDNTLERKERFETWWNREREQIGNDPDETQILASRPAWPRPLSGGREEVYPYRLPMIERRSAECVDDTWQPTLAPFPRARYGNSSVWTGSEMIVWGGYGDEGAFNTGERYDPTTDTWTATSTAFAPTGRSGHTAVWTGNEMILWGGGTNTGGRYDPASDTWTATTTTDAPSDRVGHTAVWTKTEMIVWGGSATTGDVNTGGRYNPAKDSWTATATTNAPSARAGHTAVWTGSEMIVWGGQHGFPTYLNTGGRYDPAKDTWTATASSGAPSGRMNHTAVWTDTEMIVWAGYRGLGGARLNDGRRYDPSTDTWRVMAASSARSEHTAAWTGTEMIVWGGFGLCDAICYLLGSGERYDPTTNTWTPTATSFAPRARRGHTAVWTGTEMIVWGAAANTGGRYDPATDGWIATVTNNAPSARELRQAIWTGSEMIVWGGQGLNTGGRYDPATTTWTPTPETTAPSGRSEHTAVWTGTEMIVWGGYDVVILRRRDLNTGGRYDPAGDTWAATSTSAVFANSRHTAVWAGSEMIVWGGLRNTGWRYDPAADAWAATATISAPSSRSGHTAVWASGEMIVWGGNDNSTGQPVSTGGRYDPASDAWTATATINAPNARSAHTAVWAGGAMIVWGGYTGGPFSTGGRYDPTNDTWTATASTGAPSARAFHTAVLTNREMIVWGGIIGGGVPTNTGGCYDPVSDSWSATATTNAPSERSRHTAQWTGTEMIVWGGRDAHSVELGTGGRYCAAARLGAQ